jgi:hypothetical protein
MGFLGERSLAEAPSLETSSLVQEYRNEIELIGNQKGSEGLGFLPLASCFRE